MPLENRVNAAQQALQSLCQEISLYANQFDTEGVKNALAECSRQLESAGHHFQSVVDFVNQRTALDSDMKEYGQTELLYNNIHLGDVFGNQPDQTGTEVE
ncbi:MAG: hypothetical protein ACM3QZ_01585 [Solirubrobacterales bacterium]